MLKTEAAMEIRTHARTAMSLEMIAFVGLLIFANMHLLGIGSGRSLIFLPETFDAGEWWRLVTFPFVHVTWYHLLLDGGAFFLLYRDLEELPAAMRLLSLTLCGVTSLFAALVAAPLVLTIGLCGLSGIAHGLMALTGLRFIQKEEHLALGMITFVIVVLKSIYETLAGNVVFSFMHMGLCGTPVAACHAGGVLGGIISFLILGGIRHEDKREALVRISSNDSFANKKGPIQ